VKQLPSSEDGLQAMTNGPSDPALRMYFTKPVLPPDMPQLLRDPWGRPYHYQRIDNGDYPFDLRSLGEDGVISEDDTSVEEFSDLYDLFDPDSEFVHQLSDMLTRTSTSDIRSSTGAP